MILKERFDASEAELVFSRLVKPRQLKAIGMRNRGLNSPLRLSLDDVAICRIDGNIMHTILLSL